VPYELANVLRDSQPRRPFSASHVAAHGAAVRDSASLSAARIATVWLTTDCLRRSLAMIIEPRPVLQCGIGYAGSLPQLKLHAVR